MRIMSKQVESKLARYLESVGLRFHPFDQLEASADRRLKSYIIGHQAIDDAWASDDCLLIGGSGSGRTTVAERLLDNCRIGSDATEIFPICLRGHDLDSGQIAINTARAAAVETLLEVAYQPEKFEDLGNTNRADLVGAVESVNPGILDYFLPKILKAGSYLPVAKFADPPAEILPNYPDPKRVERMVKEMQKLNRTMNLSGESILDIVPGILGLAEIKLIADFPKAPGQEQFAELEHLHNSLSRKGKVSKVILAPAGPESGNREAELISWFPDQLVDVLESRLRAASGGDFDSFDAISDPGLIYVEGEIVDETAAYGHRTPRAVVSFAKTLLELQARSGNKKSNKISSETFNKAVEKEFATSV